MRNPLIFVVIAGLAVAGTAFAQDKPKAEPKANPQAAQAAAKPAAKPASLEDRASYGIGLKLGQSLKTQEVPVNQELIVQGLRDGLGGAEPLLSADEIQSAMQELQQQLMAKAQDKRKAEGEKNLQESQAFLDKNKARPEVKTTASGLQYEVLAEGSGESPKPTDRVKVHYRGTLPDGTVFDSSYDRGEPVTFPVNGVIAGWVEALQLMKPGAKYKLYLPPGLAYGERGAGDKIGPNQALVFEVELISVEPAAAPQAEPPAEDGRSEAEPETPPVR